jgi:nucleoside-diphosphate-sugar epimerase
VAAEGAVLGFGAANGCRVSVLRIPGIYASDRVGGMPTERLRQGTPVLAAPDDVYTNHIHADDLATACQAALWRGPVQRVFNVNDDTVLRMGDYFDWAADRLGLPRPPRLPLVQAEQQLSPLRMSFMRESRRMDNGRMKRELRVRLRYPTVEAGFLVVSRATVQPGGD